MAKYEIRKTDPKLIAFEGIDGSGKSTRAKMLQDKMNKAGYETVLFQEPTNGSIGKLLRELIKSNADPLILAQLFAADRYELYTTEIKPLTDAGKYVILDRSVYSSMAYQLDPKQLSLESIFEINKYVAFPKVVFFADVSVKSALDRIKKRGTTQDSFEKKSELERIRTNYELVNGLIALRNINIFKFSTEDREHDSEYGFQAVSTRFMNNVTGYTFDSSTIQPGDMLILKNGFVQFCLETNNTAEVNLNELELPVTVKEVSGDYCVVSNPDFEAEFGDPKPLLHLKSLESGIVHKHFRNVK